MKKTAKLPVPAEYVDYDALRPRLRITITWSWEWLGYRMFAVWEDSQGKKWTMQPGCLLDRPETEQEAWFEFARYLAFLGAAVSSYDKVEEQYGPDM